MCAEIKDNPVVAAKFHPQFWQEGAWLCCRQAEKLAPGCEEYNLFGDSKKHTHTSENTQLLLCFIDQFQANLLY